MHVLVVGGTGVLGRALLPVLARRGHRVTVMAPSARLDTLPGGIGRVRASLLDTDVREHLNPVLARCDAVVNAATAMPTNPAAPEAWDGMARLRRDGTRILLRAMRDHSVPVVVQMGITMVYQDGGDRWLDESARWDMRPERRALVDPVTALENAVHDLPASGSARLILRAARFVGPGTTQDQLRDQLRRGTLTVPADRPSYISLVHVADVAAAVDAAVNAAEDGRVNEAVLNVSDEPLRTHEYLDGLARLDGHDPPSRVVGAEISHRVDSSAARNLLKWRPRHGIWPNPRFPPGH